MRFLKAMALCALGGCLTAAPALAESWPGKATARIVVPFPPGGPTDVVARLISIKLSEISGGKVIVENKPGADGNLGAYAVSSSPPDGSTLLFTVPAIITNQFFQKGVVDPSKGLEPVIVLNRVSNVLVVRPDLPVSSVEELEALARSKDEAVSCASSGSLPTMGCALFQSRTKSKLLMVRYRGNGPALAALIGGEVTMLFDVANTATEAVKAGRVKALASTSSEPMTGTFASLPLMRSKYAGFDLVAWQGLMVRSGTSPETVKAMNEAVNKVLQEPDVRKAFEMASLTPVGGPPETFAQILKKDFETYSALVKEAGIEPE